MNSSVIEPHHLKVSQQLDKVFPARKVDEHRFCLTPVSQDLHEKMKAKCGGELTTLTIESSHKLFNSICRYVALNGNKSTDGHSHSWTIDSSTVRQVGDPFDEDLDGDHTKQKEKETVKLHLGLGQHEVVFEGRLIRVVRQFIGEPVGGSCGPSVYENLVLFVEGRHQEHVLSAFCEHILAWESKKDDLKYNIYMWKPRHQYWHKVAEKRVRPIESVILPEEIKNRVVEDLTEFSSRETARWFATHGVPYKRSILFSGPPGAGKSSLITALAGHLGRNVCFLQAAHPEITDDNLQTCVQAAPAHSLIVMEDIDALFSENRESKSKNGTPLTFSGLLNALDGVCNPEGQVFILTTNHIERLDPALIRPGRVDLRVHFTTATRGQASALFRHFYPQADAELAERFAYTIAERFPPKESSSSEAAGPLNVSMAALQQLFIVCRKETPQETLERARTFEF